MGRALGLATLGIPLGFGGAASTPSPLYTNLVSFWAFEASGDLGLDSHGTNHLTNTNSVTQNGAGKVGGSASFVAASSQHLAKADNASLSIGNVNAWWACWINLAATSDFGCVLGKGNINFASTSEYALRYINTNSGLRLYASDGTTMTQLDANNTTPAALTWYFVVGYHDADKDVVGLSVNNAAPVTAAVSTGIQDNSGSFSIGAESGSGNYWNGQIDQVAFGKGYVPTDADRTWMYNGGSGRSYAEFQSYSAFQIRLWDLLHTQWWLRGLKPPEWAVKGHLPRLPRALRGRGAVSRRPSGLLVPA